MSTILTGLRANSSLQLGNYFGALLPTISMARHQAEQHNVNLFIPDLHSFTTPIDHSQLYQQSLQNAAVFLAAGLPSDQPNIYMYRQSRIAAHSELAWILDCFTGVGEMQRMTQFKDKAGKLSEDRVSMGLFNYPVLMAADILLYNATYVPVGDDQSQHLEFTRDIAGRLNNRFGDDLFVVPASVQRQHQFFGKDQGLRLRNLAVPTQKMGKSDDEQRGVVYLDEAPDQAVKKVMAATTDSLGNIKLDWDNQPGIANLLQILSLLTERPLAAVAAEWQGQAQYGPLKQAVAAALHSFLTAFQARLAAIDEATVIKRLEADEAAVRPTAEATLRRAQLAVGLRRA